MKAASTGALSLACLSVCLALTTPSRAEVVDWKTWSYACMHDHKDPYGDVLNPRNCWASAQTAKGELVHIFSFTAKGRGLGSDGTREACEYAPSKVAVDGKRIDLLSDKEQINAVLKGKSLTREVWDRGWPYCSYRDLTVSLDGVGEVYKRLVKMAPKYLPGK